MIQNTITHIGSRFFLTVILVLTLVQQVEAKKITMQVMEERALCNMGNYTSNCLQVKIGKNKYAVKELFSTPIEGFQYEEGYRYQIVVDRKKVKKTAVDASSYQYTLVKIMNKEKIDLLKKYPPFLQQISGVKWELKKVNNENVSDVGASLVLHLNNNTYWGNGGCNNFGGNMQFHPNDQSFIFDHPVSTRMYCTRNDASVKENKYISAIADKKLRVEKRNRQLFFYDNEKIVLQFEQEDLMGQWTYASKYRWNLIQFKGKTEEDNRVHVIFNSIENKVHGFSGCNSFFGGFEIEHNKIRFKTLAGTLKACMDESVNRLEYEFLLLLRDEEQQELQYDIAEQTINIYKDNKLVMMFGRGESLEE